MERPLSSTLPVTPGVYLYKDAQGRIIYVGKARNLRKRILSYFREASALTPKTVAMISHAASLETLSTTTEKEALLLEASLIKKHRPHYNIVLRDDKQYVLFRIAKDVPFPRLEVVRQARRDNARYFGPFTSGQTARETWKTIHRVFPLRRCADRASRTGSAPASIITSGNASRPVRKTCPPEDYGLLIHRVELLLAGRSRELVDMLRRNMADASEALDYEQGRRLPRPDQGHRAHRGASECRPARRRQHGRGGRGPGQRRPCAWAAFRARGTACGRADLFSGLIWNWRKAPSCFGASSASSTGRKPPSRRAMRRPVASRRHGTA